MAKSSTKLLKPLTRKGHTKLAEEHEWLARTERPKVVKGIQIAAAEGDRSENAEYIYGKKRLRELDKRLNYLDRLLTDAQIIDVASLSGNTVCFGSTVALLDEEGSERHYTIVGEGEAEHSEGSISWLSPVAKALLGKKVGDVVLVHRPVGEIEFEIIGLSYEGRDYLEPPPSP